jgi:hypothetical protein
MAKPQTRDTLVTGLNAGALDAHSNAHTHTNAYYHDHERDYRCTIRAKDPDGLYVFGVASSKIKPKAKKDADENALGDTTSRAGLMSLFHLINHRVIFPFTPTVTIGGNAEYDEYAFTHTNYKYHAFDRSAPDDIQVIGVFTAQTPKEAEYLLAVMHFLRTLTKSFFGKGNDEASILPGTPPPVMLFNYMGKYQFNDVPVVLSNYSFILEPDIDYVDVNSRDTRVPSEVTITINLKPYYNPKQLRDEFDLESFRRGGLITKGYI